MDIIEDKDMENETYENVAYVSKVGDIATSKKYDAIPRGDRRNRLGH